MKETKEKKREIYERFRELEKNMFSFWRRPATLYVQSAFPYGIISRPPSWKRQMFLYGFVRHQEEETVKSMKHSLATHSLKKKHISRRWKLIT